MPHLPVISCAVQPIDADTNQLIGRRAPCAHLAARTPSHRSACRRVGCTDGAAQISRKRVPNWPRSSGLCSSQAPPNGALTQSLLESSHASRTELIDRATLESLISNLPLVFTPNAPIDMRLVRARFQVAHSAVSTTRQRCSERSANSSASLRALSISPARSLCLFAVSRRPIVLCSPALSIDISASYRCRQWSDRASLLVITVITDELHGESDRRRGAILSGK